MTKCEGPNLEYKEKLSDSCLKTICAFANYRDGEIIFGISDDGEICPITNSKEFCESLENKIYNSIRPKPNYSIELNPNKTITLHVYEGLDKPYFLHGKTYKRNDTATIEVDQIELKRLILEGNNRTFEELPSDVQQLSFHILEKELCSSLGLDHFGVDTLKSLGLYSDKAGYNNAAAIVADSNPFPGLDIVVFGENENQLRDRITLSGLSAIEQFNKAIELFRKNYTYEIIQGETRVTKENIPVTAFREAIANAIIHRTYDVQANTKVGFYSDKVTISSPGGLPYGITKEQYLKGSFSLLRNPILGNVFFRLGIVEIFATGVRRILNDYQNSEVKPTMEIMDDALSITLPFLNTRIQITQNEERVLNLMKDNQLYSRSELESLSHLNKTACVRVLNSLLEKGCLIRTGNAKAVRYVKKFK